MGPHIYVYVPVDYNHTGTSLKGLDPRQMCRFSFLELPYEGISAIRHILYVYIYHDELFVFAVLRAIAHTLHVSVLICST